MKSMVEFLGATFLALALTFSAIPTARGERPFKEARPPSLILTHLITLPNGSSVTVKTLKGTNSALRYRPLAVGGDHACAINANHQVICWGSSSWGESGILGLWAISFPVSVQGLAGNPINLAAGESHTCAILEDGKVQCWGSNYYGQLGTGSTSDNGQSNPVFVTGLEDKAIDLAAGTNHTCALLSNGHVQCWGLNISGQIGKGSISLSEATPVTVNLPDSATWITAGCDHTCALLEDGRMYCWGWNSYGQLGIEGNQEESPAPALVTAVSGRGITIEAGCDHTCAVYQNAQGDNSLTCWGMDSALPSNANQEGTFLLIRGGQSHTCILTGDHGVLCWGSNSHGELGDGTTQNRREPAPVMRLTHDVLYISTSNIANHTCAVLNNGRIYCWGDNMWGQLGNGTLVLAPVPQKVQDIEDVTQVSAGDNVTCAVTKENTLWCWGASFNTSFGQSTSHPTPLTSLRSHVKKVATGPTDHSCAIMDDGSLRCWGMNNYGQLGDGTTNLYPPETYVTVKNLGGEAQDVAVGYDFSCALLSNGTVKCWGHNDHGQLGNGTNQDSLLPTSVSLPGGAKAVAAGGIHACAILNNGDLYCWGFNGVGEIGDGTIQDHPAPVHINFNVPAAKVTAGKQHTCALLENGQIWCWGDNSFGQLGNPNVSAPSFVSLVPVQVEGLNGPASDVDAGDYNTCAIVEGGLYCWGNNVAGQIGDGSYHLRSSPTKVMGLTEGVDKVSVGNWHTCALMDESHGGGLLCWGSDILGNLGRNRDLWWTKPISLLPGTPSPYLMTDRRCGKVGSVFSILGVNFPYSNEGKVKINGQTVSSSLSIGEGGQTRLYFDTQGADPGDYLLTIESGGKQANTIFHLLSQGEIHPKEGGGFTVEAPPHSARRFLYMRNPER